MSAIKSWRLILTGVFLLAMGFTGLAADEKTDEKAAEKDLRGWWKLDEGEGVTAKDSSGNGLAGTIVDCEWRKQGDRSFLGFTGNGQVSFPDSVAAGKFNAGTMMFWFNGASNQPPCRLLALHTTLLIDLEKDSLTAGISTFDDFLKLKPVKLASQQWYHVALLWHGNKYELWVNGKIVEERLAETYYYSSGSAPKGSRLSLGAAHDARKELFSKRFKGEMFNLKFYGRAVEEDDIRREYEAFKGELNPPDVPGGARRAIPLSASLDEAKFVKAKYYDQALQESLEPLRPGCPGKAPFWNSYARSFIYAPAFGPAVSKQYGGLSEVKGAAYYRFLAKAQKSGEVFEFKAENTWAPLTPIWDKLPVDMIDLTVDAYGKDGTKIGTAGERRFYRAAVFNGPYSAERKDYRQHGLLALEYIYNLPFIQKWRAEYKPNVEDYVFYCYPSTTIGALMSFVARYHKNSADNPERQKTLLEMGRRMADYLLSVSVKEGALAGMPPSYNYGEGKPDGGFAGQLFMNDPTVAGLGYLAVYDVTKDEKYLAAALAIADAYGRLQLPNGTWHWRYRLNTGAPVESNDQFLIPRCVINYFCQLTKRYGQSRYAGMCDRACQFFDESVVKPFNWAGQYNDGGGSKEYSNLSHNYGGIVDKWLDDPTAGNVKKAEEYMRFSEDQFIIWERQTREDKKGANQKWLTPCVTEQYNCYSPVDAASAFAASAYARLYRATGKEIYRAKAVSLANTLVNAQATNGVIPTFLMLGFVNEAKQSGKVHFWLNCLIGSAGFLLDFDEMLAARPEARNEAGRR